MRRCRLWCSVVVASASLILLAGCTRPFQPTLPEPGEYLCEWRGEDGAVMELGIYGAMVYRDIDWMTATSGEGAWSIGNGVSYRGTDGVPLITVRMSDGVGLVTLSVHGSGDGMTLVKSYTTDLPFDYTFTRGDCATEWGR